MPSVWEQAVPTRARDFRAGHFLLSPGQGGVTQPWKIALQSCVVLFPASVSA
jgi:hypothetical protein